MKTEIDELLRYAKESNNNTALQQIEEQLYQIGKSFTNLSLIKEAIEYFMRCLDIHRAIFPQVNDSTAELLLCIGKAHYYLRNPDESIEFFEKSLEMFKKIEPMSEYDIGRAIHYLGLAQFQKGKIQEALEYFRQSLEIKKKLEPSIDSEVLEQVCSYSIGYMYRILKKYNEALGFFNKSLEIWTKSKLLPNATSKTSTITITNDAVTLSRILTQIGLVYFELGRNEEALSYLKQALEKRMQTGRDISVETVEHAICCICKKIGNFQEASKYMVDELTLDSSECRTFYINMNAFNLGNLGHEKIEEEKNEDDL